MTKRDFIKLPGGSLYFASRNARDELALMSVAVGGELVAVITPRGTAAPGHLFVPDETSDDGSGWLYTIGADGFEYGELAAMLTEAA